MVRRPSAVLQHAYALFLSLGHHESHARRVNQAMQERLALGAQALREHLPDFEFRLPQGVHRSGSMHHAGSTRANWRCWPANRAC